MGNDSELVQVNQANIASTTPSYLDLEIEWDTDYFDFNRKIAYKGNIGDKRALFCQKLKDMKLKVFSEIQRKIDRMVNVERTPIACKKGCCSCCTIPVEATLQECELVINYLYNNEPILKTFIENYSQWRASLRENGDVFKRLEKLDLRGTTPSTALIQQGNLDSYFTEYSKQNIFCPFLVNKECLIYEVRPDLCAGYIVTTPSEWCNPKDENFNRKDHIQIAPPYLLMNTSFYYGNFTHTYSALMPLVVFEILKGGYFYLSKIPELSNITSEVVNDPEISKIITENIIHLPL